MGAGHRGSHAAGSAMGRGAGEIGATPHPAPQVNFRCHGGGGKAHTEFCACAPSANRVHISRHRQRDSRLGRWRNDVRAWPSRLLGQSLATAPLDCLAAVHRAGSDRGLQHDAAILAIRSAITNVASRLCDYRSDRRWLHCPCPIWACSRCGAARIQASLGDSAEARDGSLRHSKSAIGDCRTADYRLRRRVQRPEQGVRKLLGIERGRRSDNDFDNAARRV